MITFPDGYTLVTFSMTKTIPKGATSFSFTLPAELALKGPWNIQASGYVNGSPNSFVGYTAFWGNGGQAYMNSVVDGNNAAKIDFLLGGYRDV